MNTFPNAEPSRQLPFIIDLFSGCGGLAVGFDGAGFHIAGGIDIDKASADTARYNLHNRYGRLKGHICGDLTKMSAADILPNGTAPSGYIVLGGPPCQAYSIAGRGKLRSLGTDHQYDPRGLLYQDYLRLCKELDVQGIVMENVPEALNYGGLNIPELVSRKLENFGYTVGWTVLNAADYGVPQLRERMILIALKKGTCDTISFPDPTHRSPNPEFSGWFNKRKILADCTHYKPVSAKQKNLPPWVTVGDAFSDLPVLFPAATSEYRLHQPNVAFPYKCDALNDFQVSMRSWYGSTPLTVNGNSFRKTLRDFPLFEQMSAGDDFRRVVEIAESMLSNASLNHGITVENDPARYDALRKRIVPPYARDKFHEKWKRLDATKPSHTVVAHLGVDTYSHIHPWEPRGISVREAARLQSFPDEYLFQCSMSDAFRQIGNAVPPLLSKALALHLKQLL